MSVSTWVKRFAPGIAANGHVLDVAAGHGRHSRYLAEQGFRVTAVDIDISELQALARSHAVDVLRLDLELGDWAFSDMLFDGIVMTNYLHRPLLRHFMDSLAEEGLLIIDTFGKGNERLGRPRNPDFLLAPGELLQAFGGRLNIVAYEYGSEQEPRPAVRQRLCATCTTKPVPLDGGSRTRAN